MVLKNTLNAASSLQPAIVSNVASSLQPAIVFEIVFFSIEKKSLISVQNSFKEGSHTFQFFLCKAPSLLELINCRIIPSSQG